MIWSWADRKRWGVRADLDRFICRSLFSGRLVRVFRPVVQPLVLAMLDPRHDLLLGRAVGAELVRDHDAEAPGTAASAACAAGASPPSCCAGAGPAYRARPRPGRPRARDSASCRQSWARPRRVAGTHHCVPAPSDPCVPVSRHTAQADRSVSFRFCREAGLRWSPRWEARKIRCRRFAAPLSPPPIDGVPVGVCRGSVDRCLSQTFTSVSNPHIALRTIHRIRVSRLSTFLRSRGPVQPVRGALTAPVSDAFRPLAFASRILLHPLGTSAFLTVGLLAAEPPSGFPRSA